MSQSSESQPPINPEFTPGQTPPWWGGDMPSSQDLDEFYGDPQNASQPLVGRGRAAWEATQDDPCDFPVPPAFQQAATVSEARKRDGDLLFPAPKELTAGSHRDAIDGSGPVSPVFGSEDQTALLPGFDLSLPMTREPAPQAEEGKLERVKDPEMPAWAHTEEDLEALGELRGTQVWHRRETANEDSEETPRIGRVKRFLLRLGIIAYEDYGPEFTEEPQQQEALPALPPVLEEDSMPEPEASSGRHRRPRPRRNWFGLRRGQ